MKSTMTDTVPTKTTNTPPRANLQGIPRELRDMIYEHVADNEKERIVLGRRFVEARKEESLSSRWRYRGKQLSESAQRRIS